MLCECFVVFEAGLGDEGHALESDFPVAALAGLEMVLKLLEF
jgi:hypothetical protein